MQDLNDKINNGGATAQGQLSADEWNEVPSEIQNVITSVGQALSGGDLTQLVKAIVSYSANGNFFADSGIANAYVLTAIGAKQGLYAYGDGSRVAFIPSFDGTGAATINVSTLGVKDIRLSDGSALLGGEITAGELVELAYDLSNDWFVLLRLLTKTVYRDLKSGRENVLYGNFFVNQRHMTGTVILAAGVYGHDGFRAGSGGCTYTFATSENVTTVTISAGTLEQEVDGDDLFTQPYVLSFVGSCQGRIDAGTYGDSGEVRADLTGGTNAIVEFNAGTLALPQLEPGTESTAFDMKSKTIQRCQERLFRFDNDEVVNAPVGEGAIYSFAGLIITIQFPTRMRGVPDMEASASNFGEILELNSIKATTAITQGGTTSQAAKLSVSAAGLTTGNAARLRLSGTSTTFLQFSSEL